MNGLLLSQRMASSGCLNGWLPHFVEPGINVHICSITTSSVHPTTWDDLIFIFLFKNVFVSVKVYIKCELFSWSWHKVCVWCFLEGQEGCPAVVLTRRLYSYCWSKRLACTAQNYLFSLSPWVSFLQEWVVLGFWKLSWDFNSQKVCCLYIPC